MLGGFVAADMDVFRREDVHDFPEHILHERECQFIAGAEVALALRGASVGGQAAEFGISRDYFGAVAGHLDFGNDGDMTGRSIGDNSPGVFLSQIAAAGIRIAAFTVLPAAALPFFPSSSFPPGGIVGQAGIGFDFNPPAGRVGQMDVQAVEPDFRHRVDLLEDEFLVAEMPGDVEHDAPVGETRIVEDCAALERVAVTAHLGEALLGIKGAGFGVGFNADAFAVDRQPISLLLCEGGQGGCRLPE